MALHVALVFSQFHTSVGVVGVTVADCKNLAAAPATCGAAIDVPDSRTYISGDDGHVETMD